jgi:hypothetical protein
MPMSSSFSIISGLHPRPLGLGSLILLPLALRQDNMTTHQYSLHATACRVARLSTRSRQYDDVRGFYIRAFPTSGHPKVKSDITTQPTGLLLWWDSHPLVECFCGLHRPPSVKLLFRFTDPRESLLW